MDKSFKDLLTRSNALIHEVVGLDDVNVKTISHETMEYMKKYFDLCHDIYQYNQSKSPTTEEQVCLMDNMKKILDRYVMKKYEVAWKLLSSNYDDDFWHNMNQQFLKID